MARKTTDLPTASTSISGDFYIVYDSVTGLSKKIDHDNMPAGSGAPEGTAVLSTGETVGKVLQADGDNSSSWVTLGGGGDALTANPLSQFAATTIAQLNTTISDATLVDNNTAVIANTAKVGITPTQASDITTNNAKTSYTDASQVATNKTNADASKIITDNITITQAVNLDTIESDTTTNNAKISYTDSAAVTANTAKVSFDSTSSTRLANTSGTNTGDQDLSGKQDDITLTTTGSSGAATLIGATLNIPQYTGGGGGDLLAANNLSDVGSATTSRTNLSVESTTELNNRDTADRTRSNHTGTQTASTISDFDTEVSNNSSVTANTAKISYTDATAVGLNTAKLTYPSGDSTKVGHITVTQAVDLDTIESNVTTNNAKVSYTDGAAVTANTAKITYPSGDSTKVGHISVTQAVDLDAIETTVNALPVEIGFAASDETTALTTGTAKLTFRMPFAMTLTEVRASVTTAPTGSTLVADINEGGTTILSTKLSIDATEKTSETAATPPVISDSALADDAEITIDIDQIGSTIAGAGLKIVLIGTR